MKVEVTKDYSIQLKEVFKPIILETEDGEKLYISMQESGFEIVYGENFIQLKKGMIVGVPITATLDEIRSVLNGYLAGGLR